MKASLENVAASDLSPIRKTSYLQEMQCGKLGFSLICINTVALTTFAINLAMYGTLLDKINLACSAVILPSMRMFGIKNYFDFVTKPLEMGAGLARSFFTITVDPETGIWQGKHADCAHFYDGKLSSALSNFFKTENASTIVDLGCGTGAYVKDLRKAEFICDGFDGNPDTPIITGNVCTVADLTNPELQLNKEGKKYDWIFSFEVGEHLPKQHEMIFLQNVTKHARNGIVLSWAKKGQGGLGHVNEQNNDYIEAKMLELNWKRDFQAEEKLRLSTSPHCFWFRDTIMVYRPR